MPHITLAPVQQLPQIIVHLYHGAEPGPIGVYDYEVRVIRVFFVGKVLLVNLVNLEDRAHLTNVELIGHGVVEDVQLQNCKLEVHLVVLEDL